MSCGSFPDIAAVRDWLTFVRPKHADAVAAAHERFLHCSAEVLAPCDERLFGISFERVHAAIRDKLERGYLHFENVSLNLLAFIEQSTALAVDASYDGLVISIDEFQQLLGNATRGRWWRSANSAGGWGTRAQWRRSSASWLRRTPFVKQAQASSFARQPRLQAT
jgi:hypothetical protein